MFPRSHSYQTWVETWVSRHTVVLFLPLAQPPPPQWQRAEWLSGWASGGEACKPAGGTREQVRVSEQKSGQPGLRSAKRPSPFPFLLLAVRMSVWRERRTDLES